MKAIAVRVGKQAEVIDIESELKVYQEFVGGHIQAVFPFYDPITLVCNEDGKLRGLPYNRRISAPRLIDDIVGDFLLFEFDGEDFTSMSDEHIEKYLAYFNDPNRYISILKERG